jgi:hypothetical protein
LERKYSKKQKWKRIERQFPLNELGIEMEIHPEMGKTLLNAYMFKKSLFFICCTISIIKLLDLPFCIVSFFRVGLYAFKCFILCFSIGDIL